VQHTPRSILHNIAFVLALVLIGALAWRGTLLQQALLDANAKLSQRLENITLLQDIAGTVTDVETGERGFVITGDEAYLDPYLAALARLDRERSALVPRLRDVATPDGPLESLEALIERRLDIASANIQARRESGLAAAATGLHQRGGRQTMDAIRATLQSLEDAERAALASEASALRLQVERNRHESVIGALLVLLLFLGAFWAITRNLEIRRRLARQAESGEARLRALVEAVPDPLYRIDPDGTATLLGAGAGAGAPDERALATAVASHLQPSATGALRGFEWHDGLGRVHDVRVVATPGEDRLAVVRNVTSEQGLQREVREQRAFLRNVVDADENLILVQDQGGRIALCNRAFAALAGRLPDHLEGRRLEGADARVLGPLLATAADGEVGDGIVALDETGGRHRSFQVARHPVVLPDGRDGILAVAVDLSERLEVERLKTEFISTVSHELRTPLTAIRGALSMLSTGVSGALERDQNALVVIAAKNCERLVRLINDILDIEKLEAGQVRFDLQPLPLASLLENAMAENAALAREYRVELVGHFHVGDTAAPLDADRFAQVMANLVSNACKHSPEGGRVLATATVQDNEVEIAVADDGQGIPVEFRPRVFERFAQADSSDVRRSGGTGLGLAITRSLVEHMGGRIGFDTEEGHGTRFFVRFPLADQQAAAAAVHGRNGDEAVDVLLVGAGGRNQALLRALADEGMRTHAVATGAEARRWLEHARAALVVMEPVLPDENGLAFLRWLQGTRREQGPAVVVSSLEDAAAGRGSGAVTVTGWVEKPALADQVVGAIRRHQVQAPASSQVLHVEDDADLRLLVAHVLGEEGLTVHGAGSLSQARELLARQGRPDLVILDLGLPDGDGFELLDALGAFVPAVPVIVFSARDAAPPDPDLVVRHLVKTRDHQSDLVQTIRDQLSGITNAPLHGDTR